MDTKAVLEHSMISHKLTGDNYRAWKFQINAILRSQELLGVVDGTETLAANATADVNKKWSQRDGKAMAILFASLNSEQVLHVLDCKSAKSIMDVLEGIHQKKSDVRIMSLYEEYFSLKMNEDESVTAYFSKVRTIASELEDQGEKLTDNLKMCRIVSGLTPKFQHFRTVWYNIKECRTMETLLAKLQLEEDQQSKAGRETTHHVNEAAFSASHSNKMMKKKKKLPLGERKAKSKCHACGEIGHWKSDNVCNGKTENKCSNDKSKKAVAFFSANDILSADYDNVWIGDSGATRHTTYRRDWFVTFSSKGAQKGVKIANDEYLDVEGSGSIKVEAWIDDEWETRILEDVRFVPKAKVNLFSINQISKKGFDTRFTKDGCTVFDENNKTIAIGYMDSNDLVRMAFKQTKIQRSCLASEEKASANSLQQWHRRLGHVNVATIKKMCSEKSVSGIELTDTNDFFCEECLLGKMQRASHPSAEHRILQKGECIHIDLCGPMEHTGIGGVRYFMLIKDEATTFRFVYFLTEKSKAGEYLDDILSKCENAWNAPVKHIRWDNGTEFINKDVLNMLSKRGIVLERIAPRTPEQNGFIERDNRTVQESARTMLIASGLSKSLWPEAVRTAVYVLNRTTNKRNSKMTPFEQWFEERPRLDHLKVFGTTGYAHIPKNVGRKKWDAKAKKVYLVGFEPTQKNYRLYDPESNKVIVSCDVKFNENFVRSEYVNIHGTDNESDDELADGQGDSDQSHNSTTSDSNRNTNSDESNATNEKRNLRQNPSKTVRYDAHRGCLAMFVEPSTFEEAMQSEQRGEWKRAIDEELKSLAENETWEIVDKPNDCGNVVGCKWVFKIKSIPKEEPKFKARLVAKGYSQCSGIDFKETFSPVVRHDTVRCMLALAAICDMEMIQFDVKTAFLNGELEETIFMEIPNGIKHTTNQVCRLKRSLYGLKQSSRVWNSKFVMFMKKCKLAQSNSDPCVFYGEINGEKVILLLYVDDGLILSHSKAALNVLIDKLSRAFKITLGNSNYYVGLEIQRDRKGKTIGIGQSAYIDKIIRRFNMEESKSISTPADVGTFLTSFDDGDSEVRFPYREACGSLMYAATVSRPDISFAVGDVCRFMHKPNQMHVNAVKRIFRYLNHTKQMTITYGSENIELIGYTDADHARDYETSRSVTGYAFILGGGVITWKSHQQSHITLSTTESEYVALCEGTKEAIWLRDLLEDVGFGQSNGTKIFCDNLNTIRWVENPKHHHRTKHINKQLHYTREKHQIGLIEVQHVASEDQLADMLTKPLTAIKFKSNADRLGLNN